MLSPKIIRRRQSQHSVAPAALTPTTNYRRNEYNRASINLEDATTSNIHLDEPVLIVGSQTASLEKDTCASICLLMKNVMSVHH